MGRTGSEAGRRRGGALWAGLAFAVAAGCGGGGPGPGGRSGGAGGPVGAGGSGGANGCHDAACACPDPNHALCEGLCVDLDENPSHCGGCGNACAVPAHASPRCEAGVCGLGPCSPGFGDCDGDPGNGCEASLSADQAHCGGCGVACATRCAAGACADPIAVSAGGNFTCALRRGGDVYCWGDGQHGQLGDGKSISSPAPVKVALPGPAEEVAASLGSENGPHFACARLADGSVACWGANDSHQLGDGEPDVDPSPLPRKVAGLANVKALDLGVVHACAIDAAGKLFCWGNDVLGQVGDGAASENVGPVEVALGASALDVATGGLHTCALRQDGQVRCWGSGIFGQHGDGAGAASEDAPTRGPDLSDVRRVASGLRHACATVGETHALFCWGAGEAGQLGVGAAPAKALTPLEVGLSSVAALSLGDVHSGVLVGGELLVFGDNGRGQLGDGTFEDRPLPHPLALEGVVSVALGRSHTCAIAAGGNLLCWGGNASGQLGDGTLEDRAVPTPVVWKD